MESKARSFMLNVLESLCGSALWSALGVAMGLLPWIETHHAWAIAIIAALGLTTVTMLQFFGSRFAMRRKTLWIVKAEMKTLPRPLKALRAEIELSRARVDLSTMQVGFIELGVRSLYLDNKNAEITALGTLLTVRPLDHAREDFQAIGAAAYGNRAIRVTVSTTDAEAESSGLVYCASDR